MYIGEAAPGGSPASRLLECALEWIACDAPSPTAVRLVLWARCAFTVGFDGEPFAIHPMARGSFEIPHPVIYSLFMDLVTGASPSHGSWAVIVNALSDRLSDCTMHEDARYHAAFRRGGLVSRLSRAGNRRERFGTSWITFKPDETVVPGVLDRQLVRQVFDEVAAKAPAVSMTIEERTSEMPDWQ